MSLPSPVDPSMARREAALEFLYGRIDYERVPPAGYADRHFKLDRMRELLARLGTPYQALPVVHIAGTKGKGSTAAMVGSVLTSAGLRTGVFSSPHLDRIEERIAVDGQPCTADELVALVDRLRPVVAAMDRETPTDHATAASDDSPAGPGGPTYFEMTTAMALEHFTRRNVAAAVLEVGLGGRLDSTNVCQPRVSVITSISFDHTRQLGNTLESIAGEKAGIVKPGVPVVSGVTGPVPREVIRRVCRQRGCRLIELGTDFDVRYRAPRGLEAADRPGKLDFRHIGRESELALDDVSLRLPGRHQAANAAVALAVAADLRRQGWDIPDRALRAGLEGAACPARVELIARRPAVIIDAAHNVASVEALIEVLGESFSARRRLLIFATTKEKDVRGMLQRLARHFDEIVFTRYASNPRSVPPEELQAVAEQLALSRVRVCPTPAAAWNAMLSLAAPEDLIAVTGSFFLAAEMRSECRARPFPSEARGGWKDGVVGGMTEAWKEGGEE